MQNTIYFLKLLKEKDLRTYYHSKRVAYYAYLIGIHLNYTNHQLKKLVVESLLHDIGKLYINNDILNKQDKLDKHEYEVIKNHTIYINFILNDYYQNIKKDMILHHERLDGSGYPFHLKKKDIPLNSQILAIADSFDAMTSSRGYNVVKNDNEALEELFTCSIDNQLYNRYLVELLSNEIKNKCKIKHY